LIGDVTDNCPVVMDNVMSKTLMSDGCDGCDGINETSINFVKAINENTDSNLSSKRDDLYDKSESSTPQSVASDELKPSPSDLINPSPSVTGASPTREDLASFSTSDELQF
jgi:hypothetical protein